MSDIAQLGLSIDSSQAKTAASALDKLASSASNAGDATDKLAAATGKSETVIRAIQAAADRAGVSFDTMNDRVNAASDAVNGSAAASNKAAAASTTHAAALGKTATSANSASKELTGIEKIAGVLESRMLGLGSNLGLFGQILQVVGTGGLAAAAGLGAVLVIVDQLVTSADRMGALAQQLQNLSAVSGLSTTALQALENEAVGFGVSSQQTGQFLEQFTKQLDGVRKGSGDLYTQLLKIDPALADQLSTTKDTTTALNLLAQAYTKAGTSQNALAAAAGGGRNAGQVGLLLGDVATKGGVDGVTASVNQLDLLTTKQTADWAKLKTEIDDASTSAKNNIASIFAGPVLEAEKSFFDGFLEFSRSAKEFALSPDFKTLIQIIQLTHAMSNALTVPTRSGPPVSMKNFQSPQQNYGTFQGGGAAPTLDASGNPPAQPAASLAVQAQQAAAAVSFLGSAATSADKYNASVLRINAAIADNKNLTDLQGRAMQGLSLDKAASDASQYASALGELATTQDKVNVVATSFAKQMSINASLTNDQLASVKLIAQANDEWSRASQSAQLGVFDMASAQKAVNDNLQVAIDKKLLDPTNLEQMAAASQAAANKLQNLSDNAKIAGSAFPQLQQLALDAGSVNKQFDVFATTSANAITPALEGIMNGTTTLSQGFKNLGLSIVTALENAIIQLTIIKPLLSSVLGSAGGSSGLLSFLGLGGAAGAVGDSGASGLANTGMAGSAFAGPIAPFAAANGGTFGPGWGVVGERGPELINVHGGGVTVIPNQVSKPYLPGFADGGSLSSGGTVTRLPGMGQDNSQGGTHVTVGVSVDNDGNLQAYVKNVSQQAAAQGVGAFATSPQFVDHVAKASKTARSQRKM